MLQWFSANAGTIIVSAFLILVVAMIILSMVRDRHSGKSSCSHGCAGCSMSAECQRRAEEFRKKKAAEASGQLSE